MAEEKKDYFSLDGVDYILEDVSDKAKYLVGQLNVLNTDKVSLLAKIDIIETAEVGFVSKLRAELTVEESEEDKGA
jgi:hypothetical protein